MERKIKSVTIRNPLSGEKEYMFYSFDFDIEIEYEPEVCPKCNNTGEILEQVGRSICDCPASFRIKS